MSDLHTNVRLLDELVNSLDNDEPTDNLDADLIALAILKQARSNLAIVERDLENKLAKLMPKQVVIDGTGTFVKSKKKSRTQWDKDALLSAVLDSRLFNPHTGELKEETPLERVLAVWNLQNPRVTALRERNIDADDFCHTEDTGWQIRLES